MFLANFVALNCKIAKNKTLVYWEGLYIKLNNTLLCIFIFLQFYQEAVEADVWMNDRAGLAASQDYGRDEDAAVKLLKKHKVHSK